MQLQLGPSAIWDYLFSDFYHGTRIYYGTVDSKEREKIYRINNHIERLSKKKKIIHKGASKKNTFL